MSSSLFEYYRDQAVLPTDGGLDDDAGLRAHEQERRRLFTDKLALPPRAFAGARLLELGPDSGGNSLVFAAWGAACTLSEPNLAAHAPIRAYFERFGLQERLVDLLDHDVDAFPTPVEEERFDVVDAEGFIYTVRPPARWIAKLAALTRPEGFAVVSYYASWGAFFELLLKAVHAEYRRATGATSAAAARALYGTKWASIAHRRPIESWTLDVLENPFVRLEYFIDPTALCCELPAHSFGLHASWPRYEDAFDVRWFKREVDPEERLARQVDFLARSRVSYLLGRSHFIADPPAGLDADLVELVAAVDAFVDDVDRARVQRCDAILARLADVVVSKRVLSTSTDACASVDCIESVRRVLALLVDGTPEELVGFCNTDAPFIGAWGSPAHFVALRRLG